MPLVLDLLRHGDALPADPGGDASRRLSPRGIADLERLGRHFASVGWRPDRVFASPLVRSIESARIVLGALPIEIGSMNELLPDSEPEEVAEALVREQVTQGHVLLVGHQPLFSDLAGWLAGGPSPPFAPGALVRIEFADALAPGEGSIGLRLRPDEIP